MDAATRSQLEAVLEVLATTLGDDLVGVHLHGSAVHGGLHPDSDLDLLVVSETSLPVSVRSELVRAVMPVSGARAKAGPARPVELTVVVREDLRPWRYPPMCDLQYGEWERDAYEAGRTPQRRVSPDLAVMLTGALTWGRALVGPALATHLDSIPSSDVRAASLAGVPQLLEDLPHDTRNVLLTLARVWFSVARGGLASKDAAATWAIERLGSPHEETLALARDAYRGEVADDWVAHREEAHGLVARLVEGIDAAGRDVA